MTPTMLRIGAVLALPAFLVTVAQAAEPNVVKGSVITLSLHSVILNRDVLLHVWLPPGYDDPANAAIKYPVMYMLDGSTLFDAVAGEKGRHLDTSIEQLTAEGKIEPIIIVAIDELPTRDGRRNEYIPYRDGWTAPNVAPHGEVLPDFLVTELLPKIGATFRVTDDFKKTGIGGASYSGAAALYALIRQPAIFGLAILESPSLQVGNGQLLRDTVNLVGAGHRVAIGVGTRELGNKEDDLLGGIRQGDINRAIVQECQILAANLRAAALPAEVQLIIEEGAEHTSEAFARRRPKDFIFLFGKHAQ